MPGVPGWAVLGAGLGQAVKSWQEQQAQRERQQMLAMTLQKFRQDQQARQQQNQVDAAMWQTEAAGAGLGPVGGAAGAGGVGIPVSQAFGGATPASLPTGGGSSAGAIRNPGDAAIAPFTPFPSQGGSAGKPITWRPDYPGPEAAAATSGPGAPSGKMGAGGALSLENMTQLATQAGFSPDKAPVIAAVAMAESKGDPNAYNPDDPAGGSYGITQINGSHPGAQSARGNPKRAMQLAYNISKGGEDFSPWSTFTDGTYRSYLPAGGSGQGRTSPAMPGGRYGLPPPGPPAPPGSPRIGGGSITAVDGVPRGSDGPQAAQAGGQTMTDAVPAAPATADHVVQMMAPDAHAKAQRDALVRNIARIPNLNDAQRAELFVKQWSQIRPQEAEYAREYLANQRQEHSDVAADRRAERADARQADREAAASARAEAADKRKWGNPIRMEMPDGTVQYVQVNQGTSEVRPVKLPQGAELTKVGSQGQGKPASPTEVKFWTKVIQGGGSLPSYLGRGKQGQTLLQEIMKSVGEGGQSPGDFIAAHSGVKADTTSLTNMTKMSDAAISFEKLAEKNFDVALKLAPDAVPTELGPFFNRWVEQGETALGDPNVPPYVAAVITGANEYAKVMSGSTGTAASTVDSRREARELFSPYLSLPQISQVIAVAKADMKNRENTLNERVGDIKQRLGSTAPNPIAPPATPRATGQESQSAPAAAGDQGGEVVQNGWRYNAKTHEPIGPAQ